jgi:hypothetical protein
MLESDTILGYIICIGGGLATSCRAASLKWLSLVGSPDQNLLSVLDSEQRDGTRAQSASELPSQRSLLASTGSDRVITLSALWQKEDGRGAMEPRKRDHLH